MEVPYYGEIEFDGEDFCAGCKEASLTVSEEKLFGDGQCVEYVRAVGCRNLSRCRRLFRNLEERMIL